jgi:hypothetical protein
MEEREVGMDSPTPDIENYATPDDVRLAIEALSIADRARLEKAASYCIWGTEYQDPHELINEAVRRTMNGAEGLQGRRWPKTVPFMAFMVMTIQGIANDSVESLGQKNTVYIEDLATESTSADEVLAEYDHVTAGCEARIVNDEETLERQTRAKEDLDTINAFFCNDSDIDWIMMGYKDGLKPSEIRELSEMTETQYETAKRRFRRGLDKLFPRRRKR